MTAGAPILTPGAMEHTLSRTLPDGTLIDGVCHCGCGEKAPLATRTRKELGHVRGQPLRYINGHNRTTPNILEDGDAYVVRDMGYETPCWVWVRHTTTAGYARVTADGRRQPGHRYYYERARGPVPVGLELDHLCRVRACVNPDHLEAVTHAENARRGAMGKVSSDALAEIKVASGSDADVASRFGLSTCYVNRIRRGLIP